MDGEDECRARYSYVNHGVDENQTRWWCWLMEFSKRERERMEMSSKVIEDQEGEADRKWWGTG